MRLLKEAADVMRRHMRGQVTEEPTDAAKLADDLEYYADKHSGDTWACPDISWSRLYLIIKALRAYGEPAKSLPSRQENDDVFPGFRGNNDSG